MLLGGGRARAITPGPFTMPRARRQAQRAAGTDGGAASTPAIPQRKRQRHRTGAGGAGETDDKPRSPPKRRRGAPASSPAPGAGSDAPAPVSAADGSMSNGAGARAGAGAGAGAGACGRGAGSADVLAVLRDRFFVAFPEELVTVFELLKQANGDDPCTALKDEAGIVFTGPFDYLAGRFDDAPTTAQPCLHHRYPFDPPEVATIATFPGDTGRHWGYFRDHPTDGDAFVVEAVGDGKTFRCVADTLLAALHQLLATGGGGGSGKGAGEGGKGKKGRNGAKAKVKAKPGAVGGHVGAFVAGLEAAAAAASVELVGAASQRRWKKRSRGLVAPTLSGLGIVVPIVNDLGYRPLGYTPRELKRILAKAEPADGDREPVMLLFGNIDLANDECDFGMGLELGLDLWGFSLTYTGPATRFLGLAYSLLRRPGFGRIVVAHSEARDRQQLSELAGDGE